MEMFTETEMKFVPSTELPMLKIPWIRVAPRHHGAFVRGLILLRESGNVGNLLNNKDVRVVGWQYCQNKHGSLKFVD
jgi:hypothetical protein